MKGWVNDMGKATEIKTTQEYVLEVLKTDTAARNSDDYLIFAVCKKINPMCAGLPFETVLIHRKDLGLPVLETIRRTGQKIRAAHPELAGDANVVAQRELNEEVFRKYARGTC